MFFHLTLFCHIYNISSITTENINIKLQQPLSNIDLISLMKDAEDAK